MADPDRDGWRNLAADLRGQNALSDDDEAALLRHYDERAGDLEAELARIVPEYKRRLSEDGEASAKRWLRETGEALGRRHGEETRRLFSTMSWPLEAGQ